MWTVLQHAFSIQGVNPWANCIVPALPIRQYLDRYQENCPEIIADFPLIEVFSQGAALF
jgi:hypothetical protein